MRSDESRIRMEAERVANTRIDCTLEDAEMQLLRLNALARKPATKENIELMQRIVAKFNEKFPYKKI